MLFPKYTCLFLICIEMPDIEMPNELVFINFLGSSSRDKSNIGVLQFSWRAGSSTSKSGNVQGFSFYNMLSDYWFCVTFETF